MSTHSTRLVEHLADTESALGLWCRAADAAESTERKQVAG